MTCKDKKMEDCLENSGRMTHGVADAMGDKTMPIAIVGMSFRGPGDATNVENLWKMISEARESRSPIPQERWNNDAFYHPDHKHHGTHNVKAGHFFKEDLSRFDAPFFSMTSTEAAALDPSQRLLLECTYEALENGGIPMEKIVGSKTSVFVGSFATDYTDLLLRDPETVPMYQCTNASQSRAMISNRLSYFFDLHGPCVTVDTACSGSLVALHLGCRSLQTGDAKCSIVAGVNVILNHEFMITMSMMKFLSPDGRCYTFDDRGNGYARGEGVGCVILKPLVDALKDGDIIRAVIRGTGSNQDGKTSGITLPNPVAQEALIRDVYEAAGLDPKETTYVEAHGTGTAAGDPIETRALSNVFCRDRPSDDPLLIGSIKSNVGHLEGASGIAAVIKTVLMLENEIILPNRNFESPNPRIPFRDWKLKVPLSVQPWPARSPHRASINSFGYGGSNAHAIIEGAWSYLHDRGVTGPVRGSKFLRSLSETIWHRLDGIISYPPTEGEPAIKPNTHHANENFSSLVTSSGNCQVQLTSNETQRTKLFILSAFDEAAGNRQVESMIRYLSDRSTLEDGRFLDDLAYTLNERRTKFIWKATIQAKSIVELKEALGKSPRYVKSFKPPALGFIFTGQGAQWCGMGRELLAEYPVFQSTIKRISAYLESLGAPFNVEAEINMDPSISQINSALYSQPMCTAIQIGLVDLLASWGIMPASVTGHSSGEIAAAYTIGALSLEDAMAIAYYRGVAAQSMQEKSTVKGTMMAVGMSSEDAKPVLASLTTGRATVACVNSPNSITVSGDETAIEELQAIMDERKIFYRRLAVDVAYHSHHMALVADTYADAISEIQTREVGDIEFFSSVTGKQATAADLGPSYWVSNLLGQVKFANSVRLLCLQTGAERKTRRQGQSKKVNMLVEIGPHSALAGPIKQILQAEPKLKDSEITYISALIRKQNSVTTVLDLAGKLAAHNYPVNLSTLNRPVGAEITSIVVDLPSYPWNHSNTYWAEPRISKTFRTRQFPRTDLLGALDRSSNPWEPRWHNHIRLSEKPWVLDHKIQSNTVYPAAGFIAMAIEAVYQQRKDNSSKPISGFKLKDVNIGSALLIPEEEETIETLVTLKRHFDHARSPDTYWNEFHVYSVTAANTWTEHCRGLVTVQREEEVHPDDTRTMSTEQGYLRDVYTNIERNCVREFDMEEFYTHLASIGLEYGETFSRVLRAKSGHDLATGTITIPDTAAVMPLGYEHPFIVHPATLDGAFHLVFSAMSGKEGFLEDPAIPVFADEIFVSCEIPAEPGRELNVCTLLNERNQRSLRSSIWITDPYNPEGGPVVTFTDLHWKVLEKEFKEKHLGIDERVAYSLQWKADVDMMAPANLSRMHTGLVPRDVPSRLKVLDQGAVDLFERASELISDSEISQMTNYHKSLWKHMQHLADLIVPSSEHTVKDNTLCDDACLADKEQLIEKDHSNCSEGILLRRIGDSLPDILRQRLDPSTLLERETLHRYIRESWSANGIHDAAADYLSLLCHKHPDLSVLEIDGGIGSVASKAVPAMMGPEGSDMPNFVQYMLTSMQASRLEVLKAENAPLINPISIKELNMAEDPIRQGFKEASFDVIIAPAQIAANDSSVAVLRNVKKLLKNKGRLIILGTACIQPSLLLMLGVFSEWWEAQGGYSYTASDEELRKRLGQAGFSDTKPLTIDSDGAPGHKTSIIVARPALPTLVKLTDIVVITGEDDERLRIDVTHLLKLFAGMGVRANVATLEDVEPAGETCIAICDLEGNVMSNPSESVFEKIKKIFLQSEGTLWVTRGGGSLSSQNPRANIIAGFARTARAENDGSKIVTLDLDAESQLSPITTAEVICSLFEHVFASASSPENVDAEYVERRGRIMIPRIVENNPLTNKILSIRNPIPELQPFQQPGRPLVLDASRQSLTDMQFVEDKRLSGELDKGSIEIEVRAAGLTAKDVMIASAQAMPAPLGTECSGIVTKVGKEVHWFAPGDRVAGFGNGTVCNLYRGRATSFQKLPENMPFEIATSLPVAFVTAYHAVHNIAHMTSKDRVLVHSADTTIGHAVLEICLSVSSRVFASVSTWEGKRLLVSKYGLPERYILHKEDPNLKTTAMQVTSSEGFDIIFSTTHGYSSQLAWDCIAHYGRFVSLDSRDADLSGRLDMSSFKKSASFSGFNILHFLNHKPRVVDEIWASVMHLFRRKILVAFHEITTFSIGSIEDALRAVKESDIRKVVLVASPESTVKALPPDITSNFLREDASYLLVGGLGGIGRALAIWMINHGARNIIFANRSGMSRPESRMTVELLREKGATVAVYSCDVSKSEQLAELVEESSQIMPPIRGVVQGAMVLRDVLLEKMTLADYKAVTCPKIQGTWNLHNHLPKDLDFFIMLSSVSGIIGNASQAAYAAGNAFMDAFAAYRNSLGLPAVTLDLGVITGVGYLASSENRDLLEAMERQGFESMDEEKLMALIQSTLVESRRDGAQFQTITGLGKWKKGNSLPAFDSPIFSRFRRLSLDAETSSSEGDRANAFRDSLALARTIEEASELVCAALVTKLAARSGISPENVDPSKTVSEYGVDSLVAVELRNWITHEMDSTVPILELLANNPMNSLSVKIASRSKLVHLDAEKE